MWVLFLIVVTVAGVNDMETGPWFRNQDDCEMSLDEHLDDHNDVIGGYCDFQEVGGDSGLVDDYEL